MDHMIHVSTPFSIHDLKGKARVRGCVTHLSRWKDIVVARYEKGSAASDLSSMVEIANTQDKCRQSTLEKQKRFKPWDCSSNSHF
mmetsp:Transcript_15333/g.24946  ORF Transcript_15333/g.24946 Transcript_15333/m.24946 type:complete len:85 (-) Transcript_15333:153-407(-)